VALSAGAGGLYAVIGAEPDESWVAELAIGAGWLALLLVLAARAYRFIK
jgi:ABC-type uncharacterized transport system permease subunit